MSSWFFTSGIVGNVYHVPTLVEVQQAAARVGISPDDVRIENCRIIAKGTIESGKVTCMRYILKFPVYSESIGYTAGYNWANIREEGRIIEVPWKDNWSSVQ